MTAASPAKFRFDLDLGHREERNSVMSEGAMAALLNNARAEGFQDGVAEGQRGAVVRAAERLAQAAETLADHTAALNASLDDARHATLAEALEWVDGGIVRDRAALEGEIDVRIEKYLAARRGAHDKMTGAAQ